MLCSARNIQERARMNEHLEASLDRDSDTIARFTGQPARWIVPPGSA
jgi:hypothetical protein